MTNCLRVRDDGEVYGTEYLYKRRVVIALILLLRSKCATLESRDIDEHETIAMN